MSAGTGITHSESRSRLPAGESVERELDPIRHQYLVAARGMIRVNGQEAQVRDGIAITGETRFVIEVIEDTEVIAVDAR